MVIAALSEIRAPDLPHRLRGHLQRIRRPFLHGRRKIERLGCGDHQRRVRSNRPAQADWSTRGLVLEGPRV